MAGIGCSREVGSCGQWEWVCGGREWTLSGAEGRYGSRRWVLFGLAMSSGGRKEVEWGCTRESSAEIVWDTSGRGIVQCLETCKRWK